MVTGYTRDISVIFIFQLMYTAIVLYAPGTALSAVSGFRLEYLILISGLACTFYTTLVSACLLSQDCIIQRKIMSL